MDPTKPHGWSWENQNIFTSQPGSQSSATSNQGETVVMPDHSMIWQPQSNVQPSPHSALRPQAAASLTQHDALQRRNEPRLSPQSSSVLSPSSPESYGRASSSSSDRKPANFIPYTHTTSPKRRDTYPFIDPHRFRGKLRDQIVLLANAHKGAGRAVALDFASAGATVVMTARATDKLKPILDEIRERHRTVAYAMPADFSDPTVPARLISTIQKALGPVDILINISPHFGIMTSFALEQDFLSDWWKPFELAVRAPIALINAVLPSMVARGKGTIITTTIPLGFIDSPFQTADAAARAAMMRFHHCLDLEVRAKGVQTYIVHPGVIAKFWGDPDLGPSNKNKSHFAAEPRLQSELTSLFSESIEAVGGWSSAGLASGTFLALCAEPRAKCLSGLYVNAERDMEEVIKEIEKGLGNRVEAERLYRLRLDEL